VTTLVAATRTGIVRAESSSDHSWSVSRILTGEDVRCLAADPSAPGVLYAGQAASGVLRSSDRGLTWTRAGLEGRAIRSLAVSASEPGLVFAGTRPAAVLASRDGGERWSQLAPFGRLRSCWWFSPAEKPYSAYVSAIAPSLTERRVLVVGIELGAVMRSEDGGRTWSGHRRSASRDCHVLASHPVDGDWLYQAGGTGGASVSHDGGRSWRRLPGLDRKYGWSITPDPVRPDRCYLSAARARSAHGSRCAAGIFRLEQGKRWRHLRAGLPEPIASLPVLQTSQADPDHVYAAFGAGEVWASWDAGESWNRLPVDLGGRVRSLVVLDEL
jgi:photosystem II stability/assembly factor-like uncharacterized protein